MVVERDNDEIRLRFSAKNNTSSIQSILDDLSYEELPSKSNATEKDVDELAKESKIK